VPAQHPVAVLPAFDPDSGDLNAVVETTQGSRHKFTFDEKRGLYFLSAVLPVGASFPYDFGFVPSTLGGDGDPLDVLILANGPTFVGCLVPARLIGAITARQMDAAGTDGTEGTVGTREENDRLIAVPAASRPHDVIRSLDDLGAPLLEEIEHFFVSYHEIKGKIFEPTGRKGPRAATTLVRAGEALFATKHPTRKRSAAARRRR
jgi:inorganic pyrophosphatase